MPYVLPDFEHALKTFYTQKKNYEETNNKNIRKIAKNNEYKSMNFRAWEQARRELARRKKRCVSCNEQVGTDFEIKFDPKTGVRTYSMKCGNKDKSKACDLNVILESDATFLVDETIDESLESLQFTKKKIILTKNDLMFGYIDSETATKKFEELNVELSKSLEDYETALALIPRDSSANEIDETIKEFNDKLSEHKRTGTIKDYLSDIIPLAEKIRKIRHHVMEVDSVNNKPPIFKLVQKEKSRREDEHTYGENTRRVIAFTFGDKQKTRKNKSTNNKSDRKTQKRATKNNLL